MLNRSMPSSAGATISILASQERSMEHSNGKYRLRQRTQFTLSRRSIPDGERFLQALNGRFLPFAPISYVSPQNSCRFDPIYQVPHAPSIVDGFCRLPWLGSAADNVAPDGCLLVLAAARASPAARHGDATSVIIRSPPLQVGEQMWSLLGRGPGATSQRSYSMADGQIHPLDTSRVQPP
jgi:hypothetical protein